MQIIFVALLLGANAAGPITSREQFCQNYSKPGYFREQLTSSPQALGFRNVPGPLNIGICWWHSRFQRAAVQLTVMRPDLKLPVNERERRRLIDRIIEQVYHRKSVVEIPGYKDFYSFSKAHKDVIQKYLGRRQLEDAFFAQAWIRGLSGRTEVSSEELQQKMEALFDQVEVQDQIVFQMLQMPGPTAHSWLVVKMERTPTGFIYYVTDSERSYWSPDDSRHELVQYEYRFGDRSVRYLPSDRAGKHDFVPYTKFEDEDQRVKRAQAAYCSGN